MAGPGTGQSGGGDQSSDLSSFTHFPELIHPNSPMKSMEACDTKKDKGKAICEEEENKDKAKYVDLIKPTVRTQCSKITRDLMEIKAVEYNDGVPRITWTEEEV